MSTPSTTSAAVARTRFLTPDLARGLMLAPIALANVMIYLHARPYGFRQHVLTESIADQFVTATLVATIDARAYPLFAALFGYGLVHMMRRRRERGLSEEQVRHTARRRHVSLIMFGAAHAALAFSGDILGWYGLLGLVLVPLLRLGDRALVRLALVWLVISSAAQGLVFADAAPRTERAHLWSFAIAEPLQAAGWRMVEWVMGPFGLLAVLSAMLIGAWAARHRILEHPHRHRSLLRRTAVVGISASMIGGAGPALMVTGIWIPGFGAAMVLSWLHVATGVLGGLGYAALIALVAIRLSAAGWDRGRLVRGLSATGQRSLTCYLAQSVVFAVLLPAATLGWGAWLGPAAAAALALATWALTVLGAAVWAERWPGRAGPAEALLRRFTGPVRSGPVHATMGQ